MSAPLPLLVAATSRELAAGISRLRTPVASALLGIGRERAARRMREVLAAGRPSRILEIGLAGGLAQDLRPGDVVVGEWVAELGADGRAGPRLPLHPTAASRGLAALERAGITARLGGIVESSRQLPGVEKREIGRATGAIAVDMETAAIRRAAEGLPHLSLRVIFDPVDEDLAVPFEAVGPTGSVRWGALFLRLVRSPGTLRALVRDGLRSRRVFGALARATSVLEFVP
ncbi:MAG: hypothetical protein HY720_14985 [Planctomycetes bacterium]|nr:hypothetical protein [Planctomycetota bacterium]